MPGTSNPVSGNPVIAVSHPKSFRTLLGFGGSNGGSSSIKPSFFSQLNLKAGRKSFGGPTDHANDQPVLVIDPEDPELNYGGTRGTSQGTQHLGLCLTYLISSMSYYGREPRGAQ